MNDGVITDSVLLELYRAYNMRVGRNPETTRKQKGLMDDE